MSKEAKISEKEILQQVEERVKKVAGLKEDYKTHYDAIKKIETEVSLQAGAIDALRTLLIPEQPQEEEATK